MDSLAVGSDVRLECLDRFWRSSRFKGLWSRRSGARVRGHRRCRGFRCWGCWARGFDVLRFRCQGLEAGLALSFKGIKVAEFWGSTFLQK